MEVHLDCHGGFANLRLRGRIHTDELDDELAEKVETVLCRHEELCEASKASKDPHMTDAQQYELTVTPEGEDEPRHYSLDEAHLSDDVLEVLDALRVELVQRMAAKKE